jgi:NAD+ diphosphatase
VAGFLETGESLEQCVQREVKEEVGIKMKNLRYFGSQPWPYPFGLMVGFTADYDGGELRLQKEELCEGDWFTRENMPDIPDKASIARHLIDDWLSKV